MWQSSRLFRKFLRFRDLLWTSTALLFDRIHQRNSQRAPSLYYIIPEANWVIDWVGHYITREIRRRYRWSTHLTSVPEILSGQIVHYGEMGAFLNSLGKRCNRQNTIIATIFHGVRDDRFPNLAASTELFLQNAHIPRRILTASRMMQARLLSWGIPADKVVCIPLGVDLARFHPGTNKDREAIRKQLDIPAGALCIGSFQKDGDGWGEGLTPKLIKGPDLLLEVLAQLKSQFPITVLLSGPARGYVKRGLSQLNIPYRHVLVKHYPDICRLYHALDLYLVTSREEGGPLAILEALATGTPIVATKVGLAPDLLQHNWNGFLTEVEDVNALVNYSAQLITFPNLRAQFRENGLQSIQPYDWSQIAVRYYQEIYLPLIQSASRNSR